MRIGQNQRDPTLRRVMALMACSPWRLLVFILLYGLLAFLPESPPDSATQPSSAQCKPDGMPVTAQDYGSGPLQRQPIPPPPFSVLHRPRQLICLAPMRHGPPLSQNPSGLVLDSLSRPLTLDTITCWEAHDR